MTNDVDNCDDDPNLDQDNVDGDALGDACDADIDADGMPNDARTPAMQRPALRRTADARCRTRSTPTTPTKTPPADADGDGFTDASDACPTVHAATANGCPLAQVDVDLGEGPQARQQALRHADDRGE